MRTSSLLRPTLLVLNWRPLAYVMFAGGLFAALGSRAGITVRLSVAGAGVAAASGFVLDDPAAVTVAASPTSLFLRRGHRVVVATATIGFWWIAAVAVAARRIGDLPLWGRTMELSVLVAVALAVSAIAATLGNRTTGGIAGALVSIGFYAATYLPPRVWLPLPPYPEAPGAMTRLVILFAGIVGLLAWASRDPAARRVRSLVARVLPRRTKARTR